MLDFLTEVSVLNTEILDSELIARSITPARGPVINKRRQLASALLKESTGQIFVPYFHFDPIVDLRRCAALVTSFNIEIERSGNTLEQKQAALTNLKFLDARISRVICTTNEEKSIAKELLRQVKQLILCDVNDLNGSNHSSENADDSTSQSGEKNDQRGYTPHAETNDQPSTSGNTKQNAQKETFTEDFTGIPSQTHAKTRVSFNPYDLKNAMAGFHIQSTPECYNAPFSYGQNNQNSHKLPIHKWKIQFSGLNDKKDAFEFLRIVKSKANSYKTTPEELFGSASEFFTEDASKWYFSQKFVNWNDLEQRLIADFMQVIYFDDLIDTIRQTKQSYNESIIKFCTNFEDNCSRLLTPLSTLEKINILKRNVLSKYQPYIALTQFHSLNELKHALKLLEATMSQNNYGFNRNVRFDSKERRYDSRERRFDSCERQSHSPHRQSFNSSPNHVSRYDKFDSKNANNYRSSRDRTRSPYPSYNNTRNNNNNGNFRERSNSNHNHSRENSRDNSFRPGSRENSTNRNSQKQ